MSAIVDQPRSLLPSVPRELLEFKLNNSYSGFANGVRRTLLSELPLEHIIKIYYQILEKERESWNGSCPIYRE